MLVVLESNTGISKALDFPVACIGNKLKPAGKNVEYDEYHRWEEQHDRVVNECIQGRSVCKWDYLIEVAGASEVRGHVEEEIPAVLIDKLAHHVGYVESWNNLCLLSETHELPIFCRVLWDADILFYGAHF